MNTSKPAWASKTLWANALAFLSTLALANGLDIGLTAEVQAQILGGVMAVLNIVLRFVTTEAIGG